jgi:hypothetical protein
MPNRRVSSGPRAVVFQTRKPTLKAQRQTLADFHVSAQRGRGNYEEAVRRSRDRDVLVILRNRAASDGSGLGRCAESPSSRRACRPPPSWRPDRGWVPRVLRSGSLRNRPSVQVLSRLPVDRLCRGPRAELSSDWRASSCFSRSSCSNGRSACATGSRQAPSRCGPPGSAARPQACLDSSACVRCSGSVPTGFVAFRFAEYVARPRTNTSGIRSSS